MNQPNPSAKHIIEPYIARNEELKWVGMPKQGIVFRKFDTFMIPFGLFWLFFSLTWFSMALDTSIFTSVFGLPFVLIGLFLTFGRKIVDMMRRKRTIYGVTNKRIIILRGASEQRLITLDMKDITSVSFGERKDGHGSVFFNDPGRTHNLGQLMHLPSMRPISPTFEVIHDPKHVHDIIIEQQEQG